MYSLGNLPLVGSLAAGAAGTTVAATSTLPFTATSTLPFTGLEAIWIGLAGVALLALGGATRRLVPRHQA